MKKNTTLFFALFFACFLSLSLASPSHAQSLNYQLLEKIPGTGALNGSDLPGYVGAIYKVALIVVTLSAVLMISIGGFLYLTSAGNTASMSNAKGIIFDALIGLVIALSAWLVLYVINPDLVKVSLTTLPPLPASIPATSNQTSYSGTGTPPPQSSIDLANDILSSPNITLSPNGSCSSESGKVTPEKNIQDVANGDTMAACYAGANCASQGDQGCRDNSVRPSETMLRAIWTVGQSLPFTITSISGGPHGGEHSLHYEGQAIDIVPVSQALMDAFVAAGAVAPRGNATSMCEKGINSKATGVDCTTGGATHIHLIFP
jgi:hypothetical protein